MMSQRADAIRFPLSNRMEVKTQKPNGDQKQSRISPNSILKLQFYDIADFSKFLVGHFNTSEQLNYSDCLQTIFLFIESCLLPPKFFYNVHHALQEKSVNFVQPDLSE